MVTIDVNGQIMKAICCDSIVADSINMLEIKFNFSGEWYGMTKTAQFTQGEEGEKPTTYNVLIDENGLADVPNEIKAGTVHVGVFGVLGGQRMTTAPLALVVKKSSFVGDGETPIPPTPDLYQQLIMQIKMPPDYAEALSQRAPAILVDASGEMVHITDGAEGTPVESLISHIEPKQVGSGDPSPDNVRPISGWDAVSVTGTGKNIFGGETLADKTQEIVPSATRDDEARTIAFRAASVGGKVFFADFKPNTQYTIVLYGINSKEINITNLAILYTDGTNGKPVFQTAGENSHAVYTTTAGKSVEELRGAYNDGTTTLYYDKCGIFEGVLTEADFVEYQSQTLTAELPETVYGGVLNWNTGALTVKSENYTFTGEEDITVLGASGNMYFAYYGDTNKTGVHDSQAVCSHFKIGTVTSSSTEKNIFSIWRNGTTQSWRINFRLADETITDAAGCKAWLAAQYAAGTPVTVVYELVTPYTIQLTPQQLSTLKGVNNIWSDAGQTAITYAADTKLYINNQIAAIAAAMLNN